MDPTALGILALALYCDFTPGAACDLADINQMFQAGNLVTGVTTSVSTDRLDLVDNNTLDASDITEWLAQAATTNGHRSSYLRGDTELDRNVDTTDFNALASHFDPAEDEDPQNGPLGMKAISMATMTPTLPISIFWQATLLRAVTAQQQFQNRPACSCS